LRRLTAEELVDSINVAMSQELEPRQRLYLRNASTALTRALGKPASRNEISTSRPEDVAVVQALELLNGEEFHEIAYSGKVLDQAAEEKNFSKAVERLYWSALDRPPSAKEERATAHLFEKVVAAMPATKPEALEQTWIDDELPSGATTDGTGGSGAAWKWVTEPVFSGTRAHTQGGEGRQRQHYALGAKEPLHVEPSDVLFTYVYLNPKDPPKEIMLQWNAGDWEHRAFWGRDLIKMGAPRSSSRREIGDLPKTGQWVRLEVLARDVGFRSPADIVGWSFDQNGGTVYWDKAGVLKRPPNPRNEPMGDVMWALFTSPEFQYIH
jgi:hypothetical protein